MRTRGWTAEQDEKLRYYCRLDTFVPMSVMSKDIGKASRTIYDRISFLGLERPSYNWTKEQDSLLIKLYPNTEISIEAIAKKVNKTERAVRTRATILELYRYNNEELKLYILNNYGKNGITAEYISNKFSRPLKTIYRIALELGVARKQEFKQITTKQVRVINEKYSRTNTFILSADLGLPDYTIRRCAAKNGVRKAIPRKKKHIKNSGNHSWTSKQVLFLINRHESTTMQDMAKELNLPYRTVKSKIFSMGLSDRNLKIYAVGGIRFKYNNEWEKNKKLDYVIMIRELITKARIGDVYR